MPVITYRHASNGAVLTRCSQPLLGLTYRKCIEDEQLLDLYRVQGHTTQEVCVSYPTLFYLS